MPVLIDFCDPHGGTKRLRCAFDAPQHTLVAHAPAEVKPLLDAVDALSQQGFWCVGYVRYEAAPAFDAALAVHPADGPLAWFGVYTEPLPWPEGAPGADANTRVHWHHSISRAQFDAHMAQIHLSIAAGEFYQVNYTAPMSGEFTGAAPALFARLHRAQPNGYAALIDSGFEQVLSVSPELFFDWHPQSTAQAASTQPHPHALPERAADQSGALLTRPMKGTAPRGNNPAEDQALAKALVASPKERAENVMIVDLLRNDVSRIAQPHSVKVPTLFKVAIRTVTLRGQAALCGIGSGITFDATPDAEWQEWQHKRGFLERASEPFELLETLRLEDGEYLNLIAHCARLARAARHFGYVFDEINVVQTLNALKADARAEDDPQPAASTTPTKPTTTWRVRLLLAANGLVRAEKFIFNRPLAPVHIALAATSFEASHSEFTRFKTTRRAHYDAFTPTDPNVFDTLLYNAQGELTECTRGNIALLLDGVWVTPPLHCGLLDGVGREMALKEGRLTEQVVRLEDLPRVQAVAFVNSLRGWVDARLV
jgi:para-aminobenzoate synthetase/4-amino-4-deoxychorismate lyase